MPIQGFTLAKFFLRDCIARFGNSPPSDHPDLAVPSSGQDNPTNRIMMMLVFQIAEGYRISYSDLLAKIIETEFSFDCFPFMRTIIDSDTVHLLWKVHEFHQKAAVFLPNISYQSACHSGRI